MSHLIKRGDLRVQALAKSTIPDMILAAASEPEEWANIEVVTLIQHARDRVSSQVWEQTTTDDVAEIERLIEEQMAVTELGKEFVSILDDNILIGIDTDVVNDDAVDRAIVMLFSLDTFSPGTTQYF